MKSNIKCGAARCLHNCDGACDAAVVHVRPGREGTQAARCTTYAYKINNAGSRLLMEMGQDMSLGRKDEKDKIRIACGMIDCRHCKDYACEAGKIEVLSPEETVGGQCNCKTYQP